MLGQRKGEVAVFKDLNFSLVIFTAGSIPMRKVPSTGRIPVTNMS